MLSLIVVLLILVTLTILLIGGKKDDMGSAHTDDIDNKYHVSTLEKIAVLSIFRLHASPYERFVLDTIIEELEKEPES